MTKVGHANVRDNGEFVVRLDFYVARMFTEPLDPIVSDMMLGCVKME